MAWKRVKHPSEVVEVGQEIDVKILKFDRERQRVSLGMKQLGDDPWQDLARRYPPQTRSEMDWTNKNVNPSRVVSVGEEVEVMVIEIDEERRRISLGIKQCKSNPWAEFSSTFNRNDKVSGQIKSITDFGIFIGLDGGIDGLVHLSDISWDLPGEEAVRNYKKGQEIEAAVLAIDSERERISLGIKQLEKDPFSNWLAVHPKNSIVKGTVTEVDARGALVDLGDGVFGSLGEEVEAKFTNVDRKNRTIALSIKAKEVHEEQEAVSSYKSDVAAAPVGTTLGDLLKEKMSGGSK
jgi:small subunit ribosomal protein S1